MPPILQLLAFDIIYIVAHTCILRSVDDAYTCRSEPWRRAPKVLIGLGFPAGACLLLRLTAPARARPRATTNNKTAVTQRRLPLGQTLLLLAATAGTALAAPSTETPGRDPAAAGAAQGALHDLSNLADSQAQSRTVRMLLEMQNAPPPLEGTGDKRSAEAKAKEAAARAAASEEVLTDQKPEQGALDWRSGLPGRQVNSQRADVATVSVPRDALAPSPARQAADDRVDVRELMPSRVIAFLRENRVWVLLGGLVCLATVWMGASALTQRRR